MENISFLNVPSFLYLENKEVKVNGIGIVNFDVAYGGAFYVICKADELNIQLDESNYSKLIECGKRIKTAVKDNFEMKHPFEDDLSFLYGVIFTGEAKNPKNHSRNVCIFADGELDRSATGTGVSARAGLHFAKDEMRIGDCSEASQPSSSRSNRILTEISSGHSTLSASSSALHKVSGEIGSFSPSISMPFPATCTPLTRFKIP